jgi:predicted MFS family arabinose efflux permease
MSGLDARTARRRYLILLALRWLPVGLTIPVSVLLLISRGLSLGELGWVFSVQGFVVLALELPTGGLTDSLGRRPVLLLSTLIGIGALVVYYFAHSVGAFVAATALMGVYRALDSGPLEAWYVDSTLAANPDARLEGGLSAGTAVLGGSIAVGALASGGLVAWHPIDAVETLALPYLIAITIAVVSFVAIIVLMTEHRPRRGAREITAAVRAVPTVIASGFRLLRGSRILMALIAVELFWGFGMVAFESLTPVRLTEVLSGDADKAASLMGPVSSAAWAASALGAAGIVLVARRLGVPFTAGLLRLLQGATVIGMGLLGGPIGVIVAFLICYTIHGASNPLHMTLLHEQVDGDNRATVISLNSMLSQPAGAIGGIVLASLAGAVSVTVAMVVGGIVLAAAAPLYLPSWRASRASRTPADPAVEADVDAPSAEEIGATVR